MMNPCKEALVIKMEPEVYLIKLKDSLDDKTFDFFLSLTEEKRKRKIQCQKIREKSQLKLLSENLAKYAIKKSFGIDIKKQRIAYTELGKPYLLDYPDICFNISHSGRCVVCAVFSGNVGVDIQRIAEYKQKLAAKVCSAIELKHIEESTDKAVEFAKIWTKKEAYLKFLGTGIQNFNLKNVTDDIKDKISTIIHDGYAITVVY